MKLASIISNGKNEHFVSIQNTLWQKLDESVSELSLVELINNPNKIILDEKSQPISDSDFTNQLLNAKSIVPPTANIWGAGLNFNNHANDLSTEQPSSGPGSYLRPNSCLMDNQSDIILPKQSKRVTAEAELGLVIGKACKNVKRENWRDVVCAVTTVLDLTAEDIIRENPRYIPWAKGFDTFCSIGPQLITLDEFEPGVLEQLSVSTVRNGETIATAKVCQMLYDLPYLVEYFSAGRTLAPGTIICTGTPGAAVIKEGDHVEAIVEKVGRLSHRVTAAQSE
ncbi:MULTISPECIES: fumarylacetoacetate hydrolase family protein [unclassified Pseudoalteromonas]|uniref:fumarylacetoacetate hydrolase family protein n=1 Tax=unclassified Pseudoalteromonas TaxID=194690 RepID=UPI0020981163|nr:fumarylacetoacetate hydrolase family protein [Pseudoalteromonas sp. XMcav2-N]MCO7188406.1 fumarylacetoacetate hydrolase family protein [Pseudoalteromonas sp. XMcav2-N]